MTESLLWAGALRLSHVVLTGRGKLDQQKELKVQLSETRTRLLLIVQSLCYCSTNVSHVGIKVKYNFFESRL